MELIARHFDRELLRSLIQSTPINAICAFTGQPITGGIPLRNVISDVFTDFEAVKYKSDWVSVETALCILPVVQGEKGLNSLRNYSFYADEHQFRLLRREEILDCLLADNVAVPFTVAVSFSNKKHLAYKCDEQWSKNEFTIVTDQFGEVIFRRGVVLSFLPVVQAWYTVIPGKETSTQQPTWFTKENILTGNADYKRQVAYGIERYEAQNDTLKPYRDTALFQLIVHLLNKKLYAEN